MVVNKQLFQALKQSFLTGGKRKTGPADTSVRFFLWCLMSHGCWSWDDLSILAQTSNPKHPRQVRFHPPGCQGSLSIMLLMAAGLACWQGQAPLGTGAVVGW